MKMGRERWRMAADLLLGGILVVLCFDFLHTLHADIRFLAILALCFIAITFNGFLWRFVKRGKAS